MRAFYPRNVKVVTVQKQIMKEIFGFALFVVSVFSQSWGGIVASSLFMIAALLRKWVIIDEDGMHVYYNAYFFKYEEAWTFEEITSIHKDTRHCGPNECMLHIGREFMTRRYVFTLAETAEIIAMAKEKNPGIQIETM